jgi:hypothetical protein
MSSLHCPQAIGRSIFYTASSPKNSGGRWAASVGLSLEIPGSDWFLQGQQGQVINSYIPISIRMIRQTEHYETMDFTYRAANFIRLGVLWHRHLMSCHFVLIRARHTPLLWKRKRGIVVLIMSRYIACEAQPLTS